MLSAGLDLVNSLALATVLVIFVLRLLAKARPMTSLEGLL